MAEAFSDYDIKSLRVAWSLATRGIRMMYMRNNPAWVEAAGVSLSDPYGREAEDEMVVDDLLRIEAAERGEKP